MELGITGVNAELAHEAFAMVAAAEGDLASVERQLQHCSPLFRRHFAHNEGRRPAEQGTRDDEHTSLPFDSLHDVTSYFSSWLLECGTLTERAQRGLSFVLEHLSSPGGSIYLSAADGLARIASAGEVADDETLRPWVIDQLERERATEQTVILTQEVSERTVDMGAAGDDGSPSGVDAYTPLLLAHYDEGGFSIMGLMALRGRIDGQLQEAQRLAAELSVRLGELTSAARTVAQL
jgi:hypothetical protein